jgi:hypothetical protein
LNNKRRAVRALRCALCCLALALATRHNALTRCGYAAITMCRSQIRGFDRLKRPSNFFNVGSRGEARRGAKQHGRGAQACGVCNSFEVIFEC